jgi:UDP-N-acetyl-D-glucosamine dehydrogenase
MNAKPGASGEGVADRTVGIVGLGYVGLPLAVSFAKAGLSVIGIDSNPARLGQLREGISPIGDVSAEQLGESLALGLRIESPSIAAVQSCDVLFVCVPTPIDSAKNPDLAPVRAAAATIAQGLRLGQLIVLQSTTYPGTTAGPFREELERSGLIAGRDFDLAYAPERINPGEPATAASGVPRLVGGTTPRATERAVRLLERISTHVVALSSPDAAELAKLHENVFRNINIALVNQLALLCERMGVDVWEVIDAAATKPFGFMRFSPGPGVGGHCIPVDPYYLAWRAREFDFVDRFVEAAGDINLSMPRHVANLAGAALNDRSLPLRGSRVGIVGVAFKPNVGDSRNAPAAEIMKLLGDRGCEVSYHDPHVETFTDNAGRRHLSTDLGELVDGSDLVIIVTAHRGIDWALVFERATLIVDTVNRSAGTTLAPRQVLRLGAGWNTQRLLEVPEHEHDASYGHSASPPARQAPQIEAPVAAPVVVRAGRPHG